MIAYHTSHARVYTCEITNAYPPPMHTHTHTHTHTAREEVWPSEIVLCSVHRCHPHLDARPQYPLPVQHVRVQIQ